MAKKKSGPHRAKSEPKPPPAEWDVNNVKKLRIDAGLTVAELAEKAELSTGQVSDIENATGGYSPESLYKLAKALGVSRAALLPKDPWDSATDEFWPYWNQANPTQRNQIATIAKTIVIPAPRGPKRP